MARAHARLAVPAGDATHRVTPAPAATATAASSGNGLRLGRRLEQGVRLDRLVRVATWLDDRPLVLEVRNLDRRRGGAIVDRWERFLGDDTGIGEFDGEELGWVQGGWWCRRTSGRGGRRSEGDERGQDGQRYRPPGGQTVTPATGCPSGRDMGKIDMPGRVAAARWQETFLFEGSLAGGFQVAFSSALASSPICTGARITRACDPGRGRGDRRRPRRLARAGPRQSIPPRAGCRALRTAAVPRRARWPA